VLALRLATETGTFPERLESLISEGVVPNAVRGSAKNASEGQLLHVIVGFMAAWIIITFMLLFITPTFEKMFQEFGVVLPQPMLWLIAMGNFSGLWLAVLPIVLFLILIMIGPIFYGGPTWPLGIGVRMPRAGSDLLSLLAVNLQSGRTLASGVASLARYHPITSLRVRLFHVSAAIERGENGWDAMANQKLIRPQQATALKMTDDPLAQSWLLHREAQLGLRWKDERADFIARALSLLSLFLLATVVILVSVGVFMALYDLVDSMSYPENLR
jgi:type II secretory pathway component PulF